VAINLAGRQRMLSQQTTKALLLASQASTPAEFDAANGEFEAAFGLFDQTLTAFAEGGEARGGDGSPARLRRLEGEAARSVEAARKLVNPLALVLSDTRLRGDERTRQAAAYMVRHNRDLLALMNSLTTVLERDSVRQATRLRAIQTGAFVLALANFLLIVFGMLRHFREVEGDSHRWRELARHDPLTGLSNRKGFTEAALAILSRAQLENSGGAVLMLDLDGFKPVNDRYGHAMGDQILVRLADKLASAARATDVVARLGGDEFAILCPKLQGEDIEQFCSRLLSAVASAPADDTPGCRLGGSIGIACYPRDGHSLEQLLSLADRAMYAAKNAGGHRWQIA
jgi:diguanylate cyclase (GGDEF)-like protein